MANEARPVDADDPRRSQAPGGAPLPAVLVVMGVSGCGKSTVGTLLAMRLRWEFEDGDWFHPAANIDKMHKGLSLTDDDRWPWLSAIAAWIDKTVFRGATAPWPARR